MIIRGPWQRRYSSSNQQQQLPNSSHGKYDLQASTVLIGHRRYEVGHLYKMHHDHCRYIAVTLPLHYRYEVGHLCKMHHDHCRYIAVTLPLHYRYEVGHLCKMHHDHCRYVTVTLPLHYRYEVGQFYKIHHDQNSAPFTPQALSPWRITL